MFYHIRFRKYYQENNFINRIGKKQKYTFFFASQKQIIGKIVLIFLKVFLYVWSSGLQVLFPSGNRTRNLHIYPKIHIQYSHKKDIYLGGILVFLSFYFLFSCFEQKTKKQHLVVVFKPFYCPIRKISFNEKSNDMKIKLIYGWTKRKNLNTKLSMTKQFNWNRKSENIKY